MEGMNTSNIEPHRVRHTCQIHVRHDTSIFNVLSKVCYVLVCRIVPALACLCLCNIGYQYCIPKTLMGLHITKIPNPNYGSSFLMSILKETTPWIGFQSRGRFTCPCPEFGLHIHAHF